MPDRLCPVEIPALDRIDIDPSFARQSTRGLIFHIIWIFHLRRRITDEIHHLERAGLLAPLEAFNCCKECFVDRLGCVAPALGAIVHQIAVDRINILGEGGHGRDIRIPTIAIAHEPKADDRGLLCLGDLIGDRPDFLFRPLDQPAHRAGGVEHEDNINVGLLFIFDRLPLRRRRCATAKYSLSALC